MPEPIKVDYIYDPCQWEMTYEWGDRGDLVDEIYPMKEPVQFATLIEGPAVWAVDVVLTRDEKGDPDEEETQWFDNFAEAQAAADKSWKVTP